MPRHYQDEEKEKKKEAEREIERNKGRERERQMLKMLNYAQFLKKKIIKSVM